MENLIRVQPPIFPVEKVLIPEAVSTSLDNGVPVFLIEAGTEEIMRLEFTFRAGQVNEYLPLLASTTNMMLTEGSQNYKSEELNKLIDFYGAFLNISPEKDRAGIVVFFLNKHIEKVLELSREILFRPIFPEEELNALMNKRLRWYLVNREKVQNLSMDKFFESLFGKNHPYGHVTTEDDFRNLTHELLSGYHSEFYTPENMAIIVSGKIPEKITVLLNKYFGEIKLSKIKNLKPGNNLQGETFKKAHIEKKGSVQTAIRIGSATINKRHPDYTGLKVVDAILGGYFGSRLMKNIREDKGYTYGISSSLTSLDLAGYKVISTEVGKKNTRKAMDEIYNEIRLLQKESVKKEELGLVRNYMAGELLRMFDGPFALADSFRSVWDFGLDNNYYYRLAEKIKTIEPHEIIHLANTYYNIDDLYEITAGMK
jgi:predicted Zn-dependent peptidase